MPATLIDEQMSAQMASSENAILVRIAAGVTAGYGWPNNKIIEMGEEICLPQRGISLLAGRNGEGKSTFMRYLCGCLPDKPQRQVSTVYLPEELAFDPDMTPKSIVAVALGRKDLSQWFSTIAGAVLLPESKPYNTLSKGNKQKVRTLLSIGMARKLEASLLCVDELMSGLDYAVRREFWRILATQSTERHVLASLHPDDIDVEPVQTILVAKGIVRPMSVSGRVRWEDIEAEIERRREGGQQ